MKLAINAVIEGDIRWHCVQVLSGMIQIVLENKLMC